MPSNSYKTVGELVVQAEEEANEADLPEENGTEDEPLLAARRDSLRGQREAIIAEIEELIGSKDAAKQADRDEKTRSKSGVWGALHDRSTTQQILSPWFVLITLFTVIQMTRINYFVATLRSQYDYMLSFEQAVTINGFFDVALPVGGIIAIPFIGIVLDNTSTTFVLSGLVVIASAIGVLGVIPQMWAAYANVCLFVLYRPFYYTCVSDYAAKVFGFHTFGKVYGLIICLAGLFNFIQTPLDALTHKTFNRNPVPVNLMLLVVAMIVGLSLTIFVWQKSKKMSKKMLQAEAEAASEHLMPAADVETRDYGTL